MQKNRSDSSTTSRSNATTHFFENRWGTYSATYYSPTEESNTVHPAVIFAHGFHAQKEYYNWIGECLAGHSYSALLLSVPCNQLPNPQQWSDGIRSAIDYLLSKGGPLLDRICSDRIGVMGHSMGGLGALIAGAEDPRIKCIVGLAPAILPEYFSIPRETYDIQAPVQLQIASNDGLIHPQNVKTFFNDLKTEQKNYIEITGGNHMRFLDKTITLVMGEYLSRSGALGRRFKDLKANITFEEQHSISANGFIEWFNRYLEH